MRGRGAYQLAQMKHRDARIFELCGHLRSAIDIFEHIASVPFQKEEMQPMLPPAPPAPSTSLKTLIVEVPKPQPDKLAYTIKETAATLGIGRTTIYAAIRDGKIAAVKLGHRTLIPADEIRQWMASLPRA